MSKRKKKKTPNKITKEDLMSLRRKVERELRIELDIPQEHSHTWLTHKKDKAAKQKNTIRREDYDE